MKNYNYPHKKCIEDSKKRCWCISDFIDEVIIEKDLEMIGFKNKKFKNLIKEKLNQIPFYEEIIKGKVNFKYADSYYQGKFDVLMDLLRSLKKGEING